ncbi:hypothetical protein SHO565_09750 [Streptomyces sp. HO565]
MGASGNTMSGKTWIGKSRHAFCVDMARRFEAQQREALERGDEEAAERYRLWGLGFLLETEDINTGEAKRIVSDGGRTAAGRRGRSQAGGRGRGEPGRVEEEARRHTSR